MQMMTTTSHEGKLKDEDEHCSNVYNGAQNYIS